MGEAEWIALAVAGVGGIAAAAGKVWADQRSEIRQLREELAEANVRASVVVREEHGEHVRDLRRIAGLSTSIPTPAPPTKPGIPRVKR